MTAFDAAKQEALLRQLVGGVIVSCQPEPGGRFDAPESVVAFALAATAAGAKGLRIQAARNVEAVRNACALPVIGIVKRDLESSPVRITPLIADVEALADAEAAIIAVDATERVRPTPVAELIAAIHRRGRIAMADIATPGEALSAVAAGADVLASTMSGYTGPGPTPGLPDLALVRYCATLGRPVFAEGRYNTPALAAEAIRAGATAVVVGSAITRPERITAWFRAAVEAASPTTTPVLAFDIGGTKTLAALVLGAEVLERRMVPTPRDVADPGWIEAIARLASGWSGRYAIASAVVTGLVVAGRWSAVNSGVLQIPEGYPLEERLSKALGVPTLSMNDGNAAAWGEYRHGAGRGRDLAFVTVSSGIGGGIVSQGRLLCGARGFGGSLGQVPWKLGAEGRSLEARASGFGMAAVARSQGRAAEAPDAAAIFAAAGRGSPWAEQIVADAIDDLAAALVGLQAIIDPDLMVIGGGVGLAEGFIERLRQAAQKHHRLLVPKIVPAALGADAGIVGAADLALTGEGPAMR
ncbi:MAG: putative N-acetylmannosamine-6-phosphate 2-epimerase [Proteobacteria bacterium]|nr:putative N-acetylmannosamine-6-phosphate 2-epimerase [Pseudomonadota bacterium]MBI3496929.1 putative N-acetylmannosamine-6-phosphate 2-epimerase [Pseudomonadota bacterium]